MKLQILMPMGGLGSRFAKEGYATPKPLIEVDGKPMFMRALDSFKMIHDVSNIFVIRKEHDAQYSLSEQIKKSLPGANISILDHDTDGAVETCLLAENYIDDEVPLIVADCDIYFESREYFKKIEEQALTGKPDGLLLTFTSSDPRYSYVETNKDDQAIRTAEKLVISSNAILGGYFFKSGKLFKELAREFTAQDLPNGIKEYYLSHLFNILLDKGGLVDIARIDKKHIFGTPEELNAYLEGTP